MTRRHALEYVETTEFRTRFIPVRCSGGRSKDRKPRIKYKTEVVAISFRGPITEDLIIDPV